MNELAQKEYQQTDQNGREMLIRIFGKEIFIDKNDAIKLFEEFCERKGIDSKSVLPYPNTKDRDQRRLNAFAMLMPMIDDRRAGYMPDFNNSDEKKWWPFFDMRDSGFVVAYSDYAWTFAYASGGSRLCLQSEKESDKCGRELLPIWNEFLGR